MNTRMRLNDRQREVAPFEASLSKRCLKGRDVKLNKSRRSAMTNTIKERIEAQTEAMESRKKTVEWRIEVLKTTSDELYNRMLTYHNDERPINVYSLQEMNNILNEMNYIKGIISKVEGEIERMKQSHWIANELIEVLQEAE